MNLISLQYTEIKDVENIIQTNVPAITKKYCNFIIVAKQGTTKCWSLNLGKKCIFNSFNLKEITANINTNALIIIGDCAGWNKSMSIPLTEDIVDKVYNDIPNNLKGVFGRDRMEEAGIYIALHPLKFRQYLMQQIEPTDIESFVRILNTDEGKRAYHLPTTLLRPGEKFKAIYIPEKECYIVVRNLNEIKLTLPTFLLDGLNAGSKDYNLIIRYNDSTSEVRHLQKRGNIFDTVIEGLSS